MDFAISRQSYLVRASAHGPQNWSVYPMEGQGPWLRNPGLECIFANLSLKVSALSYCGRPWVSLWNLSLDLDSSNYCLANFWNLSCSVSVSVGRVVESRGNIHYPTQTLTFPKFPTPVLQNLPTPDLSKISNSGFRLFNTLTSSERMYRTLVCNEKNICLGCGFYVSDVIIEVVFWPFWLMLPGLGPNC